jgi:hypothetical protein
MVAGVIMLNCGFIEKEGMVVPLMVQPKCRLGENIKIGHNCYFTSPDMSTLIKVVEYRASDEYQASDECLLSCGYILNQRGKYFLW